MNRKRILILKILSALAYLLAGLTRFWLLVLLFLGFVSDTWPYFLWNTRQGYDRAPVYCTYLGPRGLVRVAPDPNDPCRVVTLLTGTFTATQGRR
jgi:hypothetical protein